MENDNSPDMIKEQMQQTRNSLSEKVALLEDHVMGTVQTATEAMQTTVEKVKDTVQNVTASVEDTVSSVKESVKSTFDVSSHVRENPWMAIGLSTAAGFVIGRLISGGSDTDRSSWESGGETSRSRYAVQSTPYPGSTGTAERSEPSWFDRLTAKASEELFRMGDSVMNQLMTALRTGVDEGVPRLISEVEHRITGNGHGSGNGRSYAASTGN